MGGNYSDTDWWFGCNPEAGCKETRSSTTWGLNCPEPFRSYPWRASEHVSKTLEFEDMMHHAKNHENCKQAVSNRSRDFFGFVFFNMNLSGARALSVEDTNVTCTNEDDLYTEKYFKHRHEIYLALAEPTSSCSAQITDSAPLPQNKFESVKPVFINIPSDQPLAIKQPSSNLS